MKYAILFALIALSQAAVVKRSELHKYTYERYLKDFKKTYSTKLELSLRKDIFLTNLKMIRKHNANPKNTWWMNVNKFADLHSITHMM